MPHYNFGTGRYESNPPVIRPSIRAHTATWRKYYRHTGTWPVLSVAIYALRFVLVLVGVGICVWYSETRAWTKPRIVGAALVACVLIYLWLKFEVFIWNRELRTKNLSGATDMWDVTQFPPSQP